MPTDGIAPSLSEALDAAIADSGVSPEPSDLESWAVNEEGDLELAPTGASEQPTEAKDEVASLLEAAKPSEEDQSAKVDVGSEDFWKRQVVVETSDGPQTITFGEMKNGFMRHADYTKKTQELARERQLVSEAVELHKSLTADPAGFARYLAAKAGLISGDDVPQKDVKLWTDTDVEAEVKTRLEAALADHPLIKQAQQAEAVARVEAAFGTLEEKYATKLSPEHRILILQEAQKQNSADLDFVFQALLYRGSQKLLKQKNAKGSATQRPTAVPQDEGLQVPKGKMTPEMALNLALQELGASP